MYPLPGLYREVLNSDALRYGGDGAMNDKVCAVPVFHMGQPYSLAVDLPR
ncbi:MAG: alpha amylase C-terminal domain-containing protein [Chromatiales bacterium]|nr:alpha amylase C-terminal domain-containing protein [Chromatiales bacterium]